MDRFKKTESDEVALRWWIVADHLFITLSNFLFGSSKCLGILQKEKCSVHHLHAVNPIPARGRDTRLCNEVLFGRSVVLRGHFYTILKHLCKTLPC